MLTLERELPDVSPIFLCSKIAEGLLASIKRQKALCPTWVSENRMMGADSPYPGLWSFQGYPFARRWHENVNNPRCKRMVIQKGAQLGGTETAINTSFYAMMVQSRSVLYFLPTDKNAGEFSSSRFDAALELNPVFRDFFTDVSNVRTKRAGTLTFHCRGANTRTNVKETPAAFLVFDEFDEMIQPHITLARERQAGQREEHRFEIDLSTPTVPDYGIDRERKVNSDCQSFFVACPSCGRKQAWTLQDNVVLDRENKTGFLRCSNCKTRINHEVKLAIQQEGEWVAEYPARSKDGVFGYAVNQLYSSVLSVEYIAKKLLDAEAKGPDDYQEAVNSALGIAYVPEGRKLDVSQVKACVGYFPDLDIHDCIVTMGVDVGGLLHAVIRVWLPNGLPYDIEAFTCTEFSEIAPIIKQYGVSCCVVDALPETRAARDLMREFPGKVFLCYYPTGMIRGEVVWNEPKEDNEGDFYVQVDRTSTLDACLGRIRGKTLTISKDVPEEYYQHHANLARVTRKDEKGRPKSRYLEVGPDHYAHAANYAEIAGLRILYYSKVLWSPEDDIVTVDR